MKHIMKFLLCSAAMALLLAVMPGAARAQSGTTPPQWNPPSKVTHVWLIIMENHNWTGNNTGAEHGDPDLKGNPLAPYINGELLNSAAHAEQYYNPPGNHPSATNYIWLEAGTNFGYFENGLPAQENITSDQHLVHLLDQAGITWKEYAEPNSRKPAFTDCPLDYSEVDIDHVGVDYFSDDTDDFNPQSAYCIAHVRPYAEMATDLANHNVANYNIITPNECHNGHENVSYCSDQEPADNTLRGDQWLQQNVPLITNSPEFQNGGILFITWDEAEDSGPYSDGPIPLFVLSPFIKGGGYTNSIHYDHSSLLKTLEELFGVQPLLGAAADPATNDLSDFANLPSLQK